MKLMTEILGAFFNVPAANMYINANPEFWCRNCPNDYRRNCPFLQQDSSNTGIADLCACPGGNLSQPGQPFWGTIGEDMLSSDYVLCSDKAQVYSAWIQALFPEFTPDQLSHARSTFLGRCRRDKNGLSYMLAVGPALAAVATALCVASLSRALANTPLPVIGFEVAILAAAMELIAFWPLSFTGAAALIARYAYCADYREPVVLNASARAGPGGRRSAPVLYNGSPCYDLNSDGAEAQNPFVQRLAVLNAGYLAGGVLVLAGLLALLAVVSRHADALFELTIAGRFGPARPTGVRWARP